MILPFSTIYLLNYGTVSTAVICVAFHFIIFAHNIPNYKKGCTRLAAASDKVYQLLAQGRWFSPGTPASSTTKTNRHDIAGILLKVALNTKIQIQILIIFLLHFRTIATVCYFVAFANHFIASAYICSVAFWNYFDSVCFFLHIVITSFKAPLWNKQGVFEFDQL